MLPIGSKLLFIIRHQVLSFLITNGEDFASDTVVAHNVDWDVVSNSSGLKLFAENWVVADDSGYICTQSGQILKVTPEAITKLNAPGECETLATIESRALLVSFRHSGVYEFAKDWRPLAAHPYPNGTGEYWTYLSGNGNEIALATDAKPVVDKDHSSGIDMKFTRHAPTSLWISQGREFQRVEIP